MHDTLTHNIYFNNKKIFFIEIFSLNSYKMLMDRYIRIPLEIFDSKTNIEILIIRFAMEFY